MFEPLRAAAGGLRGPYWPGCDDLNRIIALRRAPIVTAGGRPLRFVEQQVRQERFEDKSGMRFMKKRSRRSSA